jgi:hypothetical protein
MRRRVLAVVTVPLLALGLPALAVAETVGPTRLHVTPARVGARTDVVVGFAQPAITGRLPGQRIVETLQVTGPARMGCAAGSETGVAVTAAGARVSETLRPARLNGHRWCTGVHEVTLTVATTSPCAGPPRTICPQYVIAPRTVATASFRVR